MNARIALCLTALSLVLSGFTSPAMCQTKGQLKLPEFASLADKANESVVVTLDSKLLGLASRFLNSADPEQAAAQKLVSQLTGIYVRKYTFDTDYAYPKSDIEGIRRQLNAPGWSQLVGVRSGKEKSVVDVYMFIDGDKAKSLAIIASEPREFTIVNIVGNIDLEQLHDLEGNFGVPDLELETSAKQPPAKPRAAEKTK
jgi:hypothetical protein